MYTFHVEATENVQACIQSIREAGMKVGLAVKPGTSVSTIESYLCMVDMILIMTVEPGFGGQKFLESSMEKVKYIRNLHPSLDIEVDGGISLDTISIAASAGANVFVAGSSIFRSKSPRDTMLSMREIVKNSTSLLL